MLGYVLMVMVLDVCFLQSMNPLTSGVDQVGSYV